MEYKAPKDQFVLLGTESSGKTAIFLNLKQKYSFHEMKYVKSYNRKSKGTSFPIPKSTLNGIILHAAIFKILQWLIENKTFFSQIELILVEFFHKKFSQIYHMTPFTVVLNNSNNKLRFDSALFIVELLTMNTTTKEKLCNT
eukprot:snap_masked-scaffold_42-processed-gene-2.36-mRNA-1 protein AED:1.00 eAED:1.00 QI:0/0/0/0/1/1/3/0/141